MRPGIYLITLLALCFSCDIINPEEETPAFLEFGDISLITDAGNEGSDFHNINNISVFSQTEFIGTFELDAKIPMLEFGTQDFSFEPGIKVNGISSTRAAYLFYNTVSRELTTTAGETTTVDLIFRYDDDAVFETIEDFENGNEIDGLQGSVFPLITSEPSEVLEGNRSLAIRLPDNGDSFEGESRAYDIPNDRPVYIEIDYTNNQNFSVGITSTLGGIDLRLLKVTITPSEERNKIYINVTDLIRDNEGDSYKVYIKADKDESVTEGTIILDNLKLVRF